MTIAGQEQLAALEADLLRLAKQFDGPARARVLDSTVKPFGEDMEAAVRGDYGDLSMSGWGIPMVGAVRVRDDVAVAGPTPRSGGPWRVADVGRNQGSASGFHGPGVNSKTGTTRRTKSGGVAKVRGRKGKRWNGRTVGKGTWVDARDRMRKTAPVVMRKAVLKEVGEVFRVQ